MSSCCPPSNCKISGRFTEAGRLGRLGDAGSMAMQARLLRDRGLAPHENVSRRFECRVTGDARLWKAGIEYRLRMRRGWVCVKKCRDFLKSARPLFSFANRDFFFHFTKRM